jgi:hypothetical protein
MPACRGGSPGPGSGWHAALQGHGGKFPSAQHSTYVHMQGVSTTIYAATAPELRGRGGSYLVDCAVVEPSPTCRDMEQVSSADRDKALGDLARGMAWEHNDRAGPGGLVASRV